jgi:predicted DNA-binding transcriptional regulator AlpA
LNKQLNFDALSFVRPCHIKALYGISYQTVWRWRKSKDFPEPYKINAQTIGWSRAVLDDYFGISKKEP